MAVLADEFGRAVFTIAVTEDAVLRKTMQSSEQIIRTSTDRMASSFTKVSIASQQMGGNLSGVASTGMTTLSAAAAATGSQSLMVAAQVSMLALSAKGLGDAALGATAQIKAWTVATGRLLLLYAPFIIAIAAVVAIVGFYIKGMRDAAKMTKDAEDRLASITERWKTKREAIDKAVRALQNQIQVERGLAVISDFIVNTEIRAATKRLEAIKATNVLRKAHEEAAKAVDDRVTALQRETLILKGERTTVSFIVDALERASTIDRDRAQAAKETANARKSEAQEWERIKRAQGPTTQAEAGQQVRRAFELSRLAASGTERMARAVAAFAVIQKLTEDQIASLRADVGLSTVGMKRQGERQQRGGFIELSAFAQSGAGRTSPMLAADPNETQRRKREQERTDAAKQSAASLERIEQNLNPVAG